MTVILIAVNVAVFVVSTVLDPDTLIGRIGRVQADFGLDRLFLTYRDEWYRLLTSGFVHFGIIHIAFNMYMLWVLGNMLEPTLGRLRFGLLYFAGLFGGSLGVVVLQDPDRTSISLNAGASGAIFGLLAAAAVGQFMHGLNPLSTAIGQVLILNVVLTFAISNVSVGGHIGGAVAGAICGVAMLAPAHRGIPKWASVAAPVVVTLASILGAIVIAG